MRFKVDTQALFDAWTYLSKVVTRGIPFDGVDFVAKGDVLTLTHTDPEVAVRVTISGVEIIEEGTAFFPLKSLTESTKGLPGNKMMVEVWTEANNGDFKQLRVHSKDDAGGSGRMPCLEEGNFQLFELAEESELESITLTQRIIKRGIANTIFAINSGVRSPHQILLAEFVEIEPDKVTFIGSSLNHFASYTVSGRDNNGISKKLMIPQKGASILEGIMKDLPDAEVKFSFNDEFLLVEMGEISLVARLRDEERYPDFKSMRTPKESTFELIVSRADFYAAVNYINSYVGQKGLSGVLTVKDSTLYLGVDEVADGVTAANKSIPCDAQFDEEFTIAFRLDILAAACTHVESQDINILLPKNMGQAAYIYPTQNTEENVWFEQLVASNATPPQNKAIAEDQTPVA